MNIPLFPLGTVLFPDGLLPLQVFEVRYLDMIGRCHAAGTPFGVVGLIDGQEVRQAGATPERFHPVGTLASVEQLLRPQPGLMQVRAVGGQRFRLASSAQLPNGLWTGEADLLGPDLPVEVPVDLAVWKERLQDWLSAMEREVEEPAERPVRKPYRPDDCGWLANRYGELLPLDTAQRQNLMMLDNPLLRLELVVDVLERLDETRASGPP